MELVCPNIDDLVTCYTCKDQAMPPFRLCLNTHVTCSTCPKYLHRCVCGESFSQGPHTSYDCLIAAMKLKCKYRLEPERAGSAAKRGIAPLAGGCCPSKWYTVKELSDHYRGECTRNTFVCQLKGCGHICHVETITEHYESAHGPFEPIVPTDPAYPNTVSVCVRTHVEVVKRIFNGYFFFFIKSPMSQRFQDMQVSMYNINPMDRMRYTCTASGGIIKGEMICKITIALKELHE